MRESVVFRLAMLGLVFWILLLLVYCVQYLQ